uniref:Uncharacterized protein n=1 Tax=Parascaris equorum TaxID=6256 RepID=A0A914RPA8_PAREQ
MISTRKGRQCIPQTLAWSHHRPVMLFDKDSLVMDTGTVDQDQMNIFSTHHQEMQLLHTQFLMHGNFNDVARVDRSISDGEQMLSLKNF